MVDPKARKRRRAARAGRLGACCVLLLLGLLLGAWPGGGAPPPPAGRTVVTIGDSNGASAHGWVAQLRQIRPGYHVVNRSFSGNTIGFDNNGAERLNTLKNIRRYLASAVREAEGRPIDDVVVCLGTNDCKKDFAARLPEVPRHLAALVDSIRAFPFPGGAAPRITIVSPPPYGRDSILQEKYHGGDERVRSLLAPFERVAREKGAAFVDLYHPLAPRFTEWAPDGVHMVAEGQRRVAELVARTLDRHAPEPVR